MGTCLQEEFGETILSMVAIRSATTLGNRFVEFAKICRTAVESHQNVAAVISTFSSFLSIESGLTAKTAAVSLSLGIETVFSGASLDFSIRKEQ